MHRSKSLSQIRTKLANNMNQLNHQEFITTLENGLAILLQYYDERDLFSDKAKRKFLQPKKAFSSL